MLRILINCIDCIGVYTCACTMNHSAVPNPTLSSQNMNKTSGGGMLLKMSAVADSPLPTVLMGSTPSSNAPSAGGGNNQHLTATMANTKEKTPMCLINELARYNKVQHQYRLVDESGPAHKKTFSVVLKLDNEEYTAAGPSIKKAQHAAAEIALSQTTLKHPPTKSQPKSIGPTTPTVELNALAMKRGELTEYQVIENSRPPYVPNFNFRGMYNQRYHYPKIPPTYYVTLKVGNRQFFGEGRTTRVARQAAAEEALKALRDLPLPDHVKKRAELLPLVSSPPVKSESGETQPRPQSPVAASTNANATSLQQQTDAGSDLKSPISLVHELALKCWLPVNFEVIRESGPPHMRTFVTRCTVGELSTEGEGNGKKVSKKRAAEAMLEELRKLPPPPLAPASAAVPKKKRPITKSKSRNLIKSDVLCAEQKSDPQYSQGINPISRLIQIQQAKKEREPIYTVFDERGEPRQREFVMQCTLGNLETTGSGPNKKTAKRNAAEAMLQLLGYSRPVKPTKAEGSVLPGQEGDKSRKANYFEIDSMATGDKLDGEGKLGRQLVPGLLLMPPEAAFSSDLNRAPGGPIQNQQDLVNKITFKTTSVIAKELLNTGVSPTAEAIRRSGSKSISPQVTVRPKQQLLYLADVLGFQVHFTDFPKGAKIEHLSLVSLSTNPPQVSHGAGLTIEASHDQAAQTALRALAELSLDDNGVDKELTGAGMTSGNGMHLGGLQQSTAPKLTNSPTEDLGGNLKAGASVTAKDLH